MVTSVKSFGRHSQLNRAWQMPSTGLLLYLDNLLLQLEFLEACTVN